MSELMTTKEVLTALRVSMKTLQRLRVGDEFPRPVQLSARRIAWRATDIAAWVDAR